MNGVQDLSIAAKYACSSASLSGRCAPRDRGPAARSVDRLHAGLPAAVDRQRQHAPVVARHRERHQAATAFVDASGAFPGARTSRSIGPYFTEDQLHMTDEVSMPPVLDVGVMGGFAARA
jgi:hypothetical protein